MSKAAGPGLPESLGGVPCVCRNALAAFLLPGLPGRVARLPELLEQLAIAQRIHALPEIVVAVGHQLALVGESLERVLLPLRRIAGHLVEYLGLAHEERA